MKPDEPVVSDHCFVTYTARNKDGDYPRRTGPFGEEAANALAQELARKDGILGVVVESWRCVETRVVT
jgi:hypothetical protein